MKAYIALFRSINVGGKNTLPMTELIAVLDGLGAENVRTYIQSGNAVFESKEKNAARLANEIKAAIKRRRGFEPDVRLLAPSDIARVMAKNPFPEVEAEPQFLHVGFLASVPKSPDLPALESLRRNGERFQLIDSAFYLHAPAGVGKSKLAASAEKLLGVPMTDRNWRTVGKIREMAKELG